MYMCYLHMCNGRPTVLVQSKLKTCRSGMTVPILALKTSMDGDVMTSARILFQSLMLDG